MFRGEIGYLNLPVINVKKRISPRNTAKFHRENRIFAAKKLGIGQKYLCNEYWKVVHDNIYMKC